MTPLAALGARLRFNENVLATATKDFTEDDWLRRLEGGTSHALWICGHLAVSRRGLLRALGKELAPAAWEPVFGRGSKPGAGLVGVTSQELKDDFQATGAALAERLAAMSDDEAQRPYPRKLPDGSTTLEGAAHFFYWHETYHLGQLGILRKACGKPGIA